jgi:hypothetical protein
MLEFTGKLGDEMVVGKIVTAKELIKQFNIKFRKDGNSFFKMEGRTIKPDPLNGGFKYAKAIRTPTVIQGFHNGVSYEIRKYKNKSPIGNGMFRYTPGKIDGFGGVKMTYTAQMIEMAVWYYLFPLCKESPFRQDGREYMYTFYDPIKEGEISLEFAKETARVLDEIFKKDDAEIMVIARGLRVRGEIVTPARDDTAALVKLKLSQLLQKYPKDFMESWKLGETAFRGTVLSFLDSGLIEVSTDAGGQFLKFNETVGGEQITRVMGAKSARDELYLYGISHKDPHEFVRDCKALELEYKQGKAASRVGNFKLGKTIQKEDDKRMSVDNISTFNLIEVVNKAQELDVIYLDRATQKVYILTKEDEIDEKGLVIKVQNNASWKSELLNYLGNTDNKGRKTTLYNRVKNKLGNVNAESKV